MSIHYGNPTLTVENIGSFMVNSGAILFTDPCYTVDTWCHGSLPAVNGIYNVRVGTFKSDYDIKQHQNVLLAVECAIELLNETIDYEDILKFISTVSSHTREIDTLYKNTNKKYHYIIDKYINKIDQSSSEITKCRFIYNVFNNAYFNDFIDYDFWNDYWQESKIISPDNYDQLFTIRLKYLTMMIDDIKKQYATCRYNRNQYIHISVGEFTDHNDESWTESNINIGVDSGQAGMFDKEWYNTYNGGESDDINDESWEEDEEDDNIILTLNDSEPKTKTDKMTYEKICELSDREYYDKDYNVYYKVAAGVFEFGCNSSTSYGDGVYPLFVRLNEDGHVIEAVINYDEDYDEEDDE